MLVTVGENDFRVPLNNTLEYWSALQRMQVPSRLIVFPDENHWILEGRGQPAVLRGSRRWLALAGSGQRPHKGKTRLSDEWDFCFAARQRRGLFHICRSRRSRADVPSRKRGHGCCGSG